MKATLRYSITVADEVRLHQVRQLAHDFLADLDDVAISSSSSAPDDPQFTVVGAIKGKPDDTYREVVRAADAEAAAAAAVEADERRTVAAVIDGVVEVTL